MKYLKNWAVAIVGFTFIIYFHFYKLSDLPFRVWDEARLATSAYEMSQSGNLIVTTLGFNPDLIGTKPPLMIWAQALCIKVLGLTEFAVRFPAAASATVTILLVFVFVYRMTKSKWSALASVIVLCTAQCYLFDHSTRNGEYDSMLTLLTTASLLSFFMYTETVNVRKNRYLLLFFFLLAIATLTKGIAALLFTPALFVYLLLRKQLFTTVLNKYFVLGVLLFFTLVGSFYFLREIKGPGYLQAVSIQELGGRFNQVIEGHSGAWDHYWAYLKRDGFGNWYWALPSSLLVFWFYPDRKLFRAAGFCLLTAIGMLVLISFSKTKIIWCVLPAIPLFAVIIGIVIDQISGALGNFIPLNKQIIVIVCVCIFSIQPTVEAFNMLNSQSDDLTKNDFGDHPANYFAASYYFREAIAGHKDLRNQIYLCSGYDIQWKLYVYRLNELNINTSCVELWKGPKFNKGDRVIANFPDSKNFVESNYQYKLIEDFYGVRNYLITGIK